jgi:uncharacterized protein
MPQRSVVLTPGFLARLAGALLFAWLVLMLALGWQYVRSATHVSCPSAGAAPEGFAAVEVPQPDGTSLPGWWHPAQNGAALVLLAGHSGGRAAMLPEGAMLAQAGYGVLTVDYRYCSGAQATFGYDETGEALAALDYARQQPGVDRMGVFGFSAGGVAAIRAAAQTPGVDFVIAAGSYANLYDEMTAGQPVPLSLRWQLQRASALAYWLQVSTPPWQVSPIKDLPALAPRPVFLIHGEQEVERTDGLEQFAVLQAAYPGELDDRVQLWVVPGAGHGEYYAAAGAGYHDRLRGFIEESRRFW